MGTLFMDQIKKRASGFLQDKYKSARLILTDVTPAELLTEEAVNTDPWGPDAKTMTRIAEASFDVDDYWRIVDILHKRLYDVDWKQWRQAYKALVLLEFLITHGPDDFAKEFHCDVNVIKELGTFKYIDGTGFNWGESMQKKSNKILKLLAGGETLREARLKALKITKEIKGFGNLIISPASSSSSSSSSSPSSSRASRSSSFGSYSSSSTNTLSWHETKDSKQQDQKYNKNIIDSPLRSRLSRDNSCDIDTPNKNMNGSHLWDFPIEENGSLLGSKDKELEDDREKANGIFSGKATFRSLSDVGRAIKKRMDRQLSTKY